MIVTVDILLILPPRALIYISKYHTFEYLYPIPNSCLLSANAILKLVLFCSWRISLKYVVIYGINVYLKGNKSFTGKNIHYL